MGTERVTLHDEMDRNTGAMEVPRRDNTAGAIVMRLVLLVACAVLTTLALAGPVVVVVVEVEVDPREPRRTDDGESFVVQGDRAAQLLEDPAQRRPTLPPQPRP